MVVGPGDPGIRGDADVNSGGGTGGCGWGGVRGGNGYGVIGKRIL